MREEMRLLDIEAQAKAKDFRERFNIEEKPIDDIYSLAFAKEFFLLKFPFNKDVSGAYIEKKGRNNEIYKCIYINTYEPIGRLAFSFMHEIYHAYYEKSNSDVISYSQSEDPIEIKANRFASHILIPRSYLIKELNKIKWNSKNGWGIKYNQLFDLQKELKVSFLALVYAIDELPECIKPSNIKVFYKYKSERYWDELEKRTLKHDKENIYNSCNRVTEWPKGFKENIEKNISDGLIRKEELQDIFEFFEE